MRQNRLLLLYICVLFIAGALSKDASISPATESPSKSSQQEQIPTDQPQTMSIQQEKQNTGIKYSVKGHPETLNSDHQQPEIQNNAKHHTEIQHEDKQHVEPQQFQHSDQHHSEKSHHVEPQQFQHSDQHHSEKSHHTDVKNSKQQLPTGRQFHSMPYHQPMLFQPPSGFEAIRRQLGGGFGSDLVMMGLITLPILGLLTMGSSSLGSLFGLGASSSSSKKSSSKRNKRSLKEKAADAVEYAKNLWNVMEQLERAFEKYDLYQAECRLRVVCEAHHKDRRMGSWGQSILDLMRQQKELEGRELLPVSRFLFSNYADAAQAGARNENCAQLYTGCPRHLSYYLSAKEDQMENEVENGM